MMMIIILLWSQSTPSAVLPLRRLKFIVDGLCLVEGELEQLNIEFKFLINKDPLVRNYDENYTIIISSLHDLIIS